MAPILFDKIFVGEDAKLRDIISEYRIHKENGKRIINKPEFYLKWNDNTIIKFDDIWSTKDKKNKIKGILNKRYNNFANRGGKEDKSKDFPSPIMIREVNYKSYNFKKEIKIGDFNIGSLTPEDPKDDAHKGKGLLNHYYYGNTVYRVVDYCYFADDELKNIFENKLKKFITDNFMIRSFTNPYFFDWFSNLKEDFHNLKTQLMIEWCIILTLEEGNDGKGFKLWGINIEKALELIIFHPYMVYNRKVKIHNFPKDWVPIKQFWIEKNGNYQWIDRIHNSLPFCGKEEKIKLEPTWEEFQQVSKTFHKTMSDKKFKIDRIFRYQNQILYM